jgi:hypothetical protein
LSQTEDVSQESQAPCPFRIFSEGSTVFVRIGTVNGLVPSGFSNDKLQVASGGSGSVYFYVIINPQNGIIDSIGFDAGSSVPPNDEETFHIVLGTYSPIPNTNNMQISNFGCGNFTIFVCRNWFAAEPPFYTVSFVRYG